MTKEGAIRLGIIAAFVALLEVLCRTRVIPVAVLIPPSEMATSLWAMLRSGEHDADIWFSFQNIALASLFSIAGGFLIGVVVHALPRLRAALDPVLASYYAVPTFIFYPVFIIMFGVGGGAIVAIATLLAIVAMITSTLTGLDRIPTVLRKTARIYRMNPAARALLIDLPAAFPYLFTGIKLSIAYAFIGVIASEFILSGSGIGYAISYAYNNFANRTMYGLMLLIILVVTLVTVLLDAVDQRLQARRSR